MVFTGVSGQGSNFASAAYNATCSSSSGRCEAALDGIVHQSATNKWEIKGKTLNQWLIINFPSAVTLNKVVLWRTFYASDRNCKTILLRIGGTNVSVSTNAITAAGNFFLVLLSGESENESAISIFHKLFPHPTKLSKLSILYSILRTNNARMFDYEMSRGNVFISG